MKRVLNSYCANCHDNTTWTQFSNGIRIDNETNPTRDTYMAAFTCDNCGKKNDYMYFPSDEVDNNNNQW